LTLWTSDGEPVAATSADDGEDLSAMYRVLVDVATSRQLPGKRRLAMWRPGHGIDRADLQAVLPQALARTVGFRLIGAPEPPPAAVVPVVGDWRTFLRDLDRVDDQWLNSRAGLPDYGVAYQPYPERHFLPLLFAAIRYATGPKFLDVGCGPGTKMRLAEAFGFDAYGIDYAQAHVEAANRGRAEPHAWQADARSWDRYRDFDLLLLNRPMEGPEQEDLELHVMTGMRPGGVLMTVNGMIDPGRRLGWAVVDAEDPMPEVIHGVWQKPALGM
jgi:methyltransferase family protein